MRLADVIVKAGKLRALANYRAAELSTQQAAVSAIGGQIADWGSVVEVRDQQADALADFAEAVVRFLSEMESR
jgi:hypothetical protein